MEEVNVGSLPPKYRFEYYTSRPEYWGFDGLPFGGVYGVTVALAFGVSLELENLVLWLLLPLSVHIALFLGTQWSAEVRCFARFRRVAECSQASHVKVVPLSQSSHGFRRRLVVPVRRNGGEVSIEYSKKKFVWDEQSGFKRLKFELTAPVGRYMSAAGLSSSQVTLATRKYGENAYDIPVPTFSELFQEHAVAPFFVFQVICVLLWLMDEYWYYSLLTLFMLILAEAQMVHRRLHDLSELRGMRIPSRPVQVFRENWKLVNSDRLLPGDVVAVCREELSCPCDILLLEGSVLVNESMLTGESVPQMKVALEATVEDTSLDMKGLHKSHVVSAGTTIIMHKNNSKTKAYKKVPVVGNSAVAVGYVLRTGFDTTQGKLCRTILFSAERVTVSSREASYFLLILLSFALVACGYIIYDHIHLAPLRTDETPRTTFKLFLAISHIITAVVPPEFPIMLSLAVNLSLVALVQKKIFCTEPFRVPLAGKVETCCFDKTGTLTSEMMEVDGVYGCEAEDPTSTVSFMSGAVMSGCSSLMVVDGEVVGDPLEKAALQYAQWELVSADLVVRPGRRGDRIHTLRRFPFVSELQRMCVLASVTEGKTTQTDKVFALVKGSCEILAPRLKSAPANLGDVQARLTKSGLRVLCLAAKEVEEKWKTNYDQVDRDDLERDLDFCGLLGLRNVVKPFVGSVVKQLRRSYHRVVMITGDNPLTACQVAIQIGMADKPFLILEAPKCEAGEAPLRWRTRESPSETLPFDLDGARGLVDKYALCVPGLALAALSEDALTRLVLLVTVYARVSPQQKEQVVIELNKRTHTMMVGDGTNDVGALKHAHVGVSLLPFALPKMMTSRARPARPELADQAPIVRLGDASIASPFTHKGNSIKCSVNILRCGRATLSTFLMMHKIMGLNSVLSAFAMSVLTLDGVKFGDGQTAVESIFSSMCFFLVSRSAPAKTIAKERPTSSVFAPSVLISLVLQLAVHMSVSFYGWQYAVTFRGKDFKRDLEGDFEPSLTNTVVFQIMAASHVASFLANYEGQPFMQPLTSNRPLLFSLIMFVGLIFATASEAIPELNEMLSLVVSNDPAFRQNLLTLLAADIGLAVLFAKSVSYMSLRHRARASERRAKEAGLCAPPGKE